MAQKIREVRKSLDSYSPADYVIYRSTVSRLFLLHVKDNVVISNQCFCFTSEALSALGVLWDSGYRVCTSLLSRDIASYSWSDISSDKIRKLVELGFLRLREQKLLLTEVRRTREERMLPYELVLIILQFLEIRDILSMCMSCKSLFSIFQDPYLWKLLLTRDFPYSKNLTQGKTSYTRYYIGLRKLHKLLEPSTPDITQLTAQKGDMVLLHTGHPPILIRKNLSGEYSPAHYVMYVLTLCHNICEINPDSPSSTESCGTIYQVRRIINSYYQKGYRRCVNLEHYPYERPSRYCWSKSHNKQIEELVELGVMQLV